MHRIAIVAFALCLPSHAGAAQWYVSASAAAGGDGSSAKPFKKINDVLAVLKTGDTVDVLSGTYGETVNFWHIKAGTGGRTTIQAAPGHKPIIDGGGTTGFVIQAGETHFMTFKGLTVRNAPQGIAFEFYQADDGQVLSCTTDKVASAVTFYFADRGEVSDCDLYGSVNGKQTDSTVVKNSKIHHATAEGITLHANSKNCKYLSNVVYDNGPVNIYIDSASNMLVDGNLVYMSGTPAQEQAGIQLADEQYPNVTAPVLSNITITNNVLVNNSYGILFWKGSFPGKSALKNVTIANNTVVNSASVALVWDAGPHSGTIVRNNIFADEKGSASLLLLAKSTTGVTLDHNLWQIPAVTDPINWGGSTLYSHYAWKQASGQGTGDVLGDPRFVGAWTATATNFRLATASPAIDAGAAVTGLTHDFEGKSRPAGKALDIGAFESGGASTGDGSPKVDGTKPAGDGSSSVDGVGVSDGTPAAGDGGGDGDGGCGCVVHGERPLPLALLALLLVVLLGRRRR